MALPAACVSLGLPAATILAAGTGLGLLINRYVETRLDPPVISWSTEKIALMSVVVSACAIYVGLECLRAARRSTPRSSAEFGGQTLPPTSGGGGQHFPTDRYGQSPPLTKQSQSIAQYADEVAFDRRPRDTL